jgi:hypothetical protein
MLTREDISLRERTLWRMLYELLASPRDVITLRERFASWPRA